MKLSEFLKGQAKDLRSSSTEYVAVEMLKSAGMAEADARTEVAQKLMEKEAASSLVAQGIDYDQALAMVKAANVKIKDMPSYKPEQSFEEILAFKFEKAAELASELEAKADYAEEMHEKVASLEAALETRPEVEDVPEAITKFAQSGEFTFEDLEALRKLPSETLTKVAARDDKPWTMGKAAGAAEATMDPFTAFLLG